MKITRGKLTEMIAEEVRARLFESDLEEKGSKKSKKPSTAAADEEPTDQKPPADGGGVEPIASTPPLDGGLNDQEDEDGDGEDADGDGMPDSGTVDPTDGEGEDDEEAIDSDGTGGKEPSGAVNDELSGKTVQAITIEPKSQVLPGSKEIVLAFNETTDPLRILITQTGQVKFFWRGQLHDIP